MLIPLKNFRISLKLKIAFLFILLVIVMMTTVTYIFTIHELNLRKEQVQLRMERLANNIATIRSVETEDWDVYQTYINNQLTLNPDIIYIAIYNELDQLKAHTLNIEWVDLGEKKQLDRFEQATIIRRLDRRQIAEDSRKDIESKAVNIVIGEQNLGTVKIGFSLIDLNDELSSSLYRNLGLALVFIFLAIIVSYYMSQRIVNPLGKLTNAMLKISKGELNQELQLAARDEIGEMAKTFNFMTRGLQDKAQIESFGRELGFTISLDKIESLIVERITLALNAKNGFLFLREKNHRSTFKLVCAYPEIENAKAAFHCSRSLYQKFFAERIPCSLSGFSEHSELIKQMEILNNPGENSIIAPIIINEEIIALLLLGANKRSVSYSEEEKAFLSTLIGQSAFAIQNALLFEDLTEQERLKRELEIARMIQQSLLPQENPQFPGLDLDGICIPATEIGGDYYDYFKIDDQTIGIAIADVTGKGTSAAFYMAMVKGMMLSLASIFISPKELLSELNKRLYGQMDRRVFITMIYAVIDLRKGVLKFARAGHNALILLRNKSAQAECLTPAGIGLGLDSGTLFDKTISEKQVEFKTGDIFLFYTDGISEAMNHKKEEFGEQRLIDLLVRSGRQNSGQIREKTIAALHSFVKDEPQHDDITMVTLVVTGCKPIISEFEIHHAS